MSDSLTKSEKKQVAEQVATVIRQLLVASSKAGNFSLGNTDVKEAFLEGMRSEMDWLKNQ